MPTKQNKNHPHQSKNHKNNHSTHPVSSHSQTDVLDVNNAADVTQASATSRNSLAVNQLANVEDSQQFRSVLDEDGIVVSSPNRVVSRSAKVNTAFASQYENTDAIAPVSPIGNKGTMNLIDLKKRFGFSWKKFGQRFGLSVLMIGLAVLVTVSLAGSWIVDQWNSAPDPDQILNGSASQSSVILARDGKTELFKFYDKENREIVETNEPDKPAADWNKENKNYIPRNMQLAILALEDENFYNNQDGIPWSNLAGASVKCLTSGLSDCRGASGISQQLVKNVTTDDESSLDRKVRELFTALKLGNNPNYNKERILNLYLNTVGFGRNAHGVQAAAESYFGKDIRTVDTNEACFLASMPQDPVQYNTALSKPESDQYKNLIARKNSCLQKLVDKQIRPGEEKYLTQQQADIFKEKPLVIIDYKRNRKFPHFLDYVEQELQNKQILGKTAKETQDALATGGYKIITTIDPEKQTRIEEIFAQDYNRAIAASGANNGAALILDGPTGQILSMVGSVDYNNTAIDGQVNITTSPQAPGSSFKPYVFAAAFEKNFNPSTVMADVRTDFGGGYAPNNFDRIFHGLVTARYSLQSSFNIPAIKALYLAAGSGNYSNGEQGVAEVMRVSETMGVRFPLKESSPCTVSMAIGACEVTMVSHATGMNTFAQSGKLRTATPFISITKIDKDGKEKDIYRERMNGEKNQVPYPQNDRVIDPAIANQVANVMSDYEARVGIWGSARFVLQLDNWRVAAKTGTSTLDKNDGRGEQASNLWVVGYTPLYTTTVWVGNTRNEPVSANATGGGYPAILWKDIMTYLHEGKEPVPFSTEGLTPYKVNCTGATYCKGTELLTPGQIQALTTLDGKTVKAGYDANKLSIFENRNEVFFRTMKVNKADKKIPKEGTPEALLEEIQCVEAPSAFPLIGAWFTPVQEDAKKRFSDKICPKETSTYDNTTAQPTFTTNIIPAEKSPSRIVVNASSPYSGIVITQIVLKVGGIQVAQSNSASLEYAVTSETGIQTVTIEIQDSLGNQTTQSFNSVDFSLSPITPSDISLISANCNPNPVTLGNSVNCNFALPVGVTLPLAFKMFIGSNTTGSNSCTQYGSTVTCNSVPTTGNLAGLAIAIKGGLTPTGTFASSLQIQ